MRVFLRGLNESNFRKESIGEGLASNTKEPFIISDPSNVSKLLFFISITNKFE